MQPVNCFLSFADSRMHAALKRIESQAYSMNFFDDIRVLDETKLPTDFKTRWKQQLVKGNRGFGYWVWKPYLILKTLENLPDKSTLLYCDAGCHLNPRGRKKLLKYYDELSTDRFGIKAFPVFSLFYPNPERYWTKGDLLSHFSCRERHDITESTQIEATHILFRKDNFSLDVVRQWYQLFLADFSLIDDSPSKSGNMEGFREHRHDQSVFSLLFKIHGCVPFKSGETIPFIAKNPIWGCRDKGLTPSEPPFSKQLREYIKSHIKYTCVNLHHIFPKQTSYIFSFLQKITDTLP